MSLRQKLQAYLLGLHLLFLIFTILSYRGQAVLMLTIELLLVVSLAAGWSLVSRITRPLDYAKRFSGLLQDHNYAARLHAATDDELFPLVAMFNGLLDQLYLERLKLGEQRGFLDRLLEATPSAVVVFDFDHRISLLNASATTLLGLANAEGKALSDWPRGHAQFAEPLDERARRRGLHLVEQLDALQSGGSHLLSDPEGRRFRAQRGQFFDRGFPRDFLLIEELTEELERSEHETYEKLVRVLAHEVNNTVAATGSVLESLLYYRGQLQVSDAKDFSTAIEAVRRRNRSLGDFIERFTRVVKMPAASPRPHDIGELLESVVRLYRGPCRQRGIAVEWRRRDTVGLLPVDANLLEQALINIVKNAIEAAASTQDEHPGSSGHVHLELLREADQVRLSIIDSGDRLGDVPSGQIFTPFFTTKKGGQGIGLMFAREVLHRHGISYRLAATGLGETRFDLWFAAPAG